MKSKIIFAFTFLIIILAFAGNYAKQYSRTKTVLNFEITINGTETATEIPYNTDGTGWRYRPEKGNTYFIVHLTVKNKSTLERTFILRNKTTIICNGQNEINSTDTDANPDSLNGRTMKPQETKDGFIAFELPDNVLQSKNKMNLLFSASNKSISFQLDKITEQPVQNQIQSPQEIIDNVIEQIGEI